MKIWDCQSFLILSNENKNGKIINEVILSEDTPCIDPKYKNYVEKPYLLEYYYDKDKCVESFAHLTYDSNFELKDSLSYFLNNIFLLVYR
jgi:hypothetical protein